MQYLSNDFGRKNLLTKGLMLYGGKGMVENRITLSVFDLVKQPGYWERKFAHYNFMLGDTKVRLVNDPLQHDWYLELVEPWPTCTNTVITLVTTRCNYGGQREWFLCPGCEKRCGKLYRDVRDFRCRRCLDLVYTSQKQNYHTIAPTIRKFAKFRDMEPVPTRFYKGKPTKRCMRYYNLKRQVSFGMGYFGPKYLKN